MTASEGIRSYVLDSAHCGVRFSIRHFMISQVHGQFTQVSGAVQYDPADIGSLQVNAVIEAASLSTGNPARDEHVKSADFLDAAQFSQITYHSDKAEVQPDGTLLLKGEMTLHGVGKPVDLHVKERSEDVKDPWGNLRFGVHAAGTIKRSDFGITYNAVLETGGVVLSDEVEILLDLQFTRSEN